MTFDWLKKYQHNMQKPADYAEKTLAAYRLGMKAGGSIVGVRLEVQADGCPAAQALFPDRVYSPDDAPRVPLPDCPRGNRCTCVYRPVMTYERPARAADPDK
ncbi:MAG: hypothetical protein KC418_20140 [Anaerolineales bacterium]|nr:hypothetical protein [Anaerolineales bacterium]MCB8951652.1 hypothetical protein [Ardenticatenales bacterium]